MKRAEYLKLQAEKWKGNKLWKHQACSKHQFKKGHKVPKVWREQAARRNFKGGVSRASKMYRQWREAVLKRDNNTCCICKRHDRLIAHHIDDDIALRFVVSNGETVCRKCHPLRHPELVNNFHKQ